MEERVRPSRSGLIAIELVIAVGVFALCAGASALSSIASMPSEDMAFVAQVEQRPVVMVATQIDMPATPAVAAVGSAVGHVLGAVHVHAAPSASSRAAAYLYVVNEIAFRHWPRR